MLTTKQVSMLTGKSTGTLVRWSRFSELQPFVERKEGGWIYFKESVIPFLKTYKPERKKRKKEEKDRAERKGDTICWGCKTNINECMWMQFHIPVEGWVAEEVKNSNKSGKVGYRVQSCPNYRER